MTAGEVAVQPSGRSCEVCGREGIKTPRCAVCVRDHGYGPVVIRVRFGVSA